MSEYALGLICLIFIWLNIINTAPTTYQRMHVEGQENTRSPPEQCVHLFISIYNILCDAKIRQMLVLYWIAFVLAIGIWYNVKSVIYKTFNLFLFVIIAFLDAVNLLKGNICT